MEIINYEETLKELREFNNLNLSSILNQEMHLKDASTDDLIQLYDILEKTKQNLLKMKELVYRGV